MQRTIDAKNLVDHWEQVGDRLQVPLGTRKVIYRFFAARKSGTRIDSHLDDAFVYLLPEDFAPDQGAYGNTENELLVARQKSIVLRTPDLYLDWQRDLPRDILWDSYGNGDDIPVRIELYQDGPDGPAWLRTIAETTADDGEYSWTPQDDSIDFGTHGLRIRVSLAGNQAVFDTSAETFTVPEDTVAYYVNDDSVDNDEYTTAPGDTRNSGKLPSLPKRSPANILRAYSLGAGDTLFVDTGRYDLYEPLLISGTVGIGDDEGFTLTGPTDASRVASFSHAHPATVAPLIELNNADRVTVANLTLSDEQYGLWAHDESTELTATGLIVAGHSADGIRLDTGATAFLSSPPTTGSRSPATPSTTTA